jgi:hypothetical protein
MEKLLESVGKLGLLENYLKTTGISFLAFCGNPALGPDIMYMYVFNTMYSVGVS